MLFQLPFQASHSLQHLILLMNTLLLMPTLVVSEYLYSEASPAHRRQLIYFIPLVTLLTGIFVLAAYAEIKKT